MSRERRSNGVNRKGLQWIDVGGIQYSPTQEARRMTQYVYSVRGEAVGYVYGKYIHSMWGDAIGQLNGTHVHRLDGAYVGELHDDMVLDMHLGNFGNIGNPGNPGNRGNPGNPGNRGSGGSAYRDVFEKLLK